MKCIDILVEGLLKALSRLPLPFLYVISDISSLLMRSVFRYRRQVVETNIRHSFPEKTPAERRQIVRRFYSFFCDYVVETLKLLTMDKRDIRRRMVFEGVDKMEEQLKTHPFVFIYLGHYGNWEWISTLPAWFRQHDTHGAQLYRPLNNKAFDNLFMHLRTRFGAENISKYDSLRRILSLKKEGRKTIIGFISDQSPGVNSIHDWVDFLHQDTPVFTGTERIGKKVDAAVFFADVTRLRRGYYKCTLRLMTDDIRNMPDYTVTELYMRELEAMIRRAPHLWLWSHRRWKHRRPQAEIGGQHA